MSFSTTLEPGKDIYMFSMNSRFKRNEKTAWRIIEGEGVLVDTDGGNFIHLNETAAEIWNSMDGKRTVAEITEHICDTFEVTKESAEKDTIEFLDDLLKHGVVECRKKE